MLAATAVAAVAAAGLGVPVAAGFVPRAGDLSTFALPVPADAPAPTAPTTAPHTPAATTTASPVAPDAGPTELHVPAEREAARPLGDTPTAAPTLDGVGGSTDRPTGAAAAPSAPPAIPGATDFAAHADRFDAKLDEPQWALPVNDYRLSSDFGYRDDPLGGGGGDLHAGLDFAAPTGTPVVAAHSGEVVFAGREGGFGKKVVVRAVDGTETWYAHLSRIDHDGGPVEVGDQIGRVGSTGRSTGPHLHFEVRPGGGEPVDPAAWLRDNGVAP